jgi:hypothetical protein
MQVSIKLDDDQVESILVEGLKKSYAVNLTFPNEPDFEELNKAFMVLLPYFMGENKAKKFVDKATKESKYVLDQDAILRKYGKVLAEAYNGL